MKSSVAQSLAAGAVLLFGCLAAPVRADILYTSNFGSIDTVPSSGVSNTFTTVSLNNPQDIAFSISGTLYVANYGSDSIAEYSQTGNYLGTFASGSNELSGPVGMAFDSAGNLYVANQSNDTIEKFSTTGVASVFISAAAGLSAPSALAFDSAGNLYVASYTGDSIQKFSATGTALGTFASGSSILSGPDGLAFDSSGNLYVANTSSNTIEKISSSGSASLFADTGLSGPVGLAFDSSGNLYAANSDNGTVEKFSSSGTASLFASGFGFSSPEYLAFTNNAGQPLLGPGTQVAPLQYWNGSVISASGSVNGGTGTWDNASTNWTDPSGATSAAWGGNSGVFAGTAGTITLGANIFFNTLEFQTTGYVVNRDAGNLYSLQPGASATIITDIGVTTTINAPLTGSGSLTKSGSGTLVLGGANTYSGATTISSGTLVVGMGNTVPSTSALIVNAGGTFDVNSLLDTVASIADGANGGGTISLGSGILTTGGGNTSTSFSGTIQDGGVSGGTQGELTKVGAGTFTLSGTNTYTGPTTISAGAIQFAKAAALYDTTSSTTVNATTGNLTVASGASAIFNVGGPGEFTSTQFTALAALGSFGGGFENGSTIGIDTTNAPGAVVLNAGIANPDGGANVLGLTKFGAGTLTFGATNSYTGNTTIAAGELITTVSGALPSGSALILGTGNSAVTGEVDLFGTNQSVRILGITPGNTGGTGNIITSTNGAATLTVGSSFSVFGGLITGPVSLVKAGSVDSRLTLTAANTYTGSTTIEDATLALYIDNALPITTTLTLNEADGQGVDPTLYLGHYNQTLAALNFVAGYQTNATVDVAGGVLTLAGNVNVTDNSTGPGYGGASFIQDSVGGGALNLGNATRTFTIAGQMAQAEDLQITAVVQGNGGVVINASPSHNDGSEGGLVFGAVNTYTGSTTVAQGRLTTTVSGALPSTTDVILGTASSALTGDIDLSGTSQTVDSLSVASGNTSGTGNFITSNNGPATLTVSSTTTNSNFGGLITGPVSLVKAGAGTTVTLTAINDYTGTTTVNAGTLSVNSSITGGGAVTLNGGTLTVTGTIATASTVGVNSGGTLTGTGSANGTVTISSGGNLNPGDATPGTFTVGNLILNAGANSNFRLAQADTAGSGVNDLVNVTGNLTLAGNLNVTELTGFGLGSYTLFTYGGSLGGTGFNAINLPGNYTAAIVTGVAGQVDLTVSAGTSQYWDGTGAINDGVISGGSGNWNTTTNNWTTFSGATNSTWQSGTAVFDAPGGTVTLTSAISALGLTFSSSGYVISGTNTLTLLGPAPTISVTASGNSATIGVKLAGTAGLTASGAGTLILTNAANSYTGGTTISNGTLQIGTTATAGSLGGGAVSVSNGGTLVLVNVSGNALSAGVSNGVGALGTLNVNSKNTSTLSGPLTNGAAGQLALTQSGSGTTILTNASNTYSGATTVSAGVLQIGTTTTAGSIGSNSAVSVGGGTLSLLNVAGNVLANNIGNGLSGTGLVSINSTTSMTLSGTLSNGAGVLALTQSGTGTTTLTGANTYTGATTLTAGTLQLGDGVTAGTSLGTSSVTVSGTGILAINLSASSTFASGVNLSGTGATLKAIQTGSIDISGVIGGTGVFDQNGTGTTDLQSTETYTGNTNVNAGTLQVDGSLAAGSTVTVGTLGTLAGAGTINGKVTLTGNGSIDFNSGSIGGTLTVTGGNWTGTGTVGGVVTSSSNVFTISDNLTIIAAGGLAVTGGSIAGTGTLTGNLNYTSSASSTFGGIVADGAVPSTVSMNKASSTLILTGANTYTGATTISSGTLQLGDGATTGSSLGGGPVTVSGTGVLAVNLPNTSTFSKNVSLTAAGASLKAIQAGTNTLSGVISGTGGLNQDGTGTTILTGTNTYTGTTSVTAGTLQVDSSLAAGSTVNVAAAGTLAGAGTVAGTVNVLSGGNLDAGDSSGPGTLTVGKLVLNTGSNANFRLAAPGTTGGGVNDLINVTGNLTIAGNLNVTELTGFGIGSYTLFTYGGTLTNTGFGAINGTGGFVSSVSTGVAHQVNLVVSGTAITLYWDGTGAVNNGVISGGSGTWNNTTNNWTNSSGTTNSAWQSGTAVFNAPGGTVTVAAPISVQGLIFGSTGYTLGGSSALNLVGTAASAPTISVTNAGTTATIGAPITGQAGLAASGAGTLILISMTNGYTGGTDITNGFLQVGTTAAAGSIGGGTISIASGGTLTVINAHGNVLANNVTDGVAGVGTLIINSTNSNTLSGALTDGATGQLALTQSGTGTTTLTNAGNAFSGATTISKGTLQIGTATAAGSLGANSAVSVGTSTLSLVNVAGNILANNISDGLGGTGLVSVNSTTNLTLSGALTNGAGTLALTKAGTGTTTLTGSDTYTGATTVSAGTLQIGNGTAGSLLGTSGVTVSGTGILAMDLATGSTFSQNVSLSAAGASLKGVEAGATSNTVSGVISGTGIVNQNGPGTTILTGTNTYTGATNVTTGTLEVDGSLAVGSTVNVATGGTLTGTGTIKGKATLTGSGAIEFGTGGIIDGTLTVTGGNWSGVGTVAGVVTSSASVFNINDNLTVTAAGGLAVTGGTIAGTGTLTGSLNDTSSTSMTFGGVIAGAASSVTMNKASSTLTLTGTNTYAGATTITAGTLQVGNGTTTGATLSTSTVTVGASGTLTTDLASGETFANNVTDSGHVIATGVADNYTVSSLISGTGNFTKTGANIVTVTNANTYKGGTAVSAGTLLVNNSTGSGTGTEAVTVNNGGTLGGSGTISGATTLASGGILFPGAGTPGTAGTTLHESSLIWNGGGTLTLQLADGADDALALTGALTKGTAGTYTLDLINAGLISTSTYNLTLVTFASSTFTAANFTVELPVNYTGTLVKTSTSLEIENLTDPPPGSSELPAGGDLAVAGTVNSELSTLDALTVTPTPEPGSATLLAFGGAALLGWRRRRTNGRMKARA